VCVCVCVRAPQEDAVQGRKPHTTFCHTAATTHTHTHTRTRTRTPKHQVATPLTVSDGAGGSFVSNRAGSGQAELAINGPDSASSDSSANNTILITTVVAVLCILTLAGVTVYR
jgi:hypothetical protein